MKIRNLLLIAVVALLFVSCKEPQQVPYMTNIDQIPPAALATATTQAGDFTIKPGDMLQINVSASNADAVKPFNKIQYIPTLGTGMSYTMGDNSSVFYLVDDHGNIEFPVLGRLHISGMTKKSLEDYISSLICPRYLTEKPGVECRIQNFRVYCIGEFGHAGVTLQGRRDNIMLIRTDANGQRHVKRINLGDANFMTMPEFELQQNDILYVQPNESKARQAWSAPPMVAFGSTILSIAMSLITFITVLAKK